MSKAALSETKRYQAYPEYKDSGVEWLGEIPSHWKTCRLKHLASIKNGQDYKAVQSEVGYPVMGSGGQFAFSTEFMYDKPSVLLGRKGTIDKPLYINEPFWTVDTMYYTEMQPETDAKYLYYLTTTIQFARYSTNTALPSMTQEHLGNYIFAVPVEVSDRTQIANFLDHETAKIDTLIDKQQQLIKLLKEKRQAVISHAVTKGLNPQAPMKDSGVEWLKEVPEHWEVLPTKRLFKLVAEPSEPNNDHELLSVYTAIGVAPRRELEQKGNKASSTDGYWLVKKGDIIVNKLLAWMGAVGYSNYDGVTSPAYDILRKIKSINPKFYHYLFRQEFTQQEFKRWSRGIMEMRLRLYFEELGRIFMPVPPVEEQNAIVEKIEQLESQFANIENDANKQIDLLKERRTALISAAVTGKIDVRNWQAPTSQNQALEQTA
ncbi:restriction endonuclease subunit S [Vibrio cyclitrophicus]|uniref:restriction endonuclease subunit S n=1 Tax=Vibrio cyclitrophicus TaxID=47951 RepID=UPI000C83A789|nr:restriction endonuclease subunit S [Vibrio cyclitrophicus]PME47842.1 restriction endonuclease subunit S [Vibrio cyclitrophicus]